jgi:hypothetical protein
MSQTITVPIAFQVRPDDAKFKVMPQIHAHSPAIRCQPSIAPPFLFLAPPPSRFLSTLHLKIFERKHKQPITRAHRRPGGAIARGMTRACRDHSVAPPHPSRGVPLAPAQTAGDPRPNSRELSAPNPRSPTPHRAAIPLYPSLNTQGSFDTTVSSGPRYSEGKAVTQTNPNVSPIPQIFAFRLSHGKGATHLDWPLS